MTSSKDQRLLRGRPTLNREIARLAACVDRFGGFRCVIVTFEGAGAQSAAAVSAREKVRAIARAGGTPIIHRVDGCDASALRAAFAAYADADDVAGVLPHMPIPAMLRPALTAIAPAQDLDAVRPGAAPSLPAAAQAVLDLLEPHRGRRKQFAVVGAEGRIGRAVSRVLATQDEAVVPIERGDDLGALLNADVIVSAAGVPGLLNPRCIGTPTLVVDVGFTPTPQGPRGDVDPALYGVLPCVTPVPGGVGPLAIAVLLSRLAKNVELRVTPTVTDRGNEDLQLVSLASPLSRLMRDALFQCECGVGDNECNSYDASTNERSYGTIAHEEFADRIKKPRH
jgi:methylenetetrahydrofolate dehydrogenase (NADP+)/methenyltetrahydrofolate cyclohydrolase